MISFACKNIDLRDIIQCSFDLNKTDYQLLTHLLRVELQSISQISKDVQLERSTIQKSISRLFSRGLLERRQMNLSQGGYHYVYGLADKEGIRSRLFSIVDGWHSKVRDAIKTW